MIGRSLAFAASILALNSVEVHAANVLKFSVAGLPASDVLNPSVSLAGFLSEATVGELYTFDFNSVATLSGGLTTSDLTWGFSDSDAAHSFPAGINLSASTGVFSGTPTTSGSNTFEIVAAHTDGEGRQIYTLVINETVLNVVQISAGGNHTCAVTATGGVKCWGLNSSGQLGDGTYVEKHTPVDVAGLTSGVVAVESGGNHTCAVTDADGVKCWGANGSGQLGRGTTFAGSPVGADVAGLTSGVASITASAAHTCAITTAGGAKCWGRNYYGHLGDGTSTDRSVPVDVSGLTSGVTSISAGGASGIGSKQTCAVHDGAAKCWGDNDAGQHGNGGKSRSYTPKQVTGLTSGVYTVSAGFSNTCALMLDTSVKCWGANYNGSIGDGTTTERLTPVAVSGLSSGVTALSVGYGFACVVHDSAAKCWGYNVGRLGNGITAKSTVPVSVSGLESGVSAISAGESHACAAKTDGSAFCWGYNTNGRVGDGTTTNTLVPVELVP